MKKGIIVIAVIIIGAALWFGTRGTPTTDVVDTVKDAPVYNPDVFSDKGTSTPVSGSVKLGNLTEYKNLELGFSVKYPSVWTIEDALTSVGFVIPIEKNANLTVDKLQTNINVLSGKCSFPPVTTIKEQGTLTVGDKKFNMITMSNTIRTKTYYNRMYSLDKDGVCYMFGFASITTAPEKPGTAEATKINAANKAKIDASDKQFTDLVKTFEFIKLPDGPNEADVMKKTN